MEPKEYDTVYKLIEGDIVVDKVTGETGVIQYNDIKNSQFYILWDGETRAVVYHHTLVHFSSKISQYHLILSNPYCANYIKHWFAKRHLCANPKC